MNPSFPGDSYDIVKRFFCDALRAVGYTVFIDALFTGDWADKKTNFYSFLGGEEPPRSRFVSGNAALFLDPETGINRAGGPRHVSYQRLALESQNCTIVFAFDQSFSRSRPLVNQWREKLDAMADLGCAVIYYNSHAHFLFISREMKRLAVLREHLVGMGLPPWRLVGARGLLRDDPPGASY